MDSEEVWKREYELIQMKVNTVEQNETKTISMRFLHKELAASICRVK